MTDLDDSSLVDDSELLDVFRTRDQKTTCGNDRSFAPLIPLQKFT